MAGQNATQCVTYLDEAMSNADRKYWMVNPDRARRTGRMQGTGFMVADSPMAIGRMGEILFRLIALATAKLHQARRAWTCLKRQQIAAQSLE